MPKITFAKSTVEISVENGANLMQSLLKADIPVASSCHGDGICAKCKVRLLEGTLPPPNTTEEILAAKFRLASNERISCQCSVIADLRIDTSYW